MTDADARVIVLEPTDEPKWCDTCHRRALYAFPLKLLTDHGVADGGTCWRCAACWQDTPRP
jgi:hypothetical protein